MIECTELSYHELNTEQKKIGFYIKKSSCDFLYNMPLGVCSTQFSDCGSSKRLAIGVEYEYEMANIKSQWL